MRELAISVRIQSTNICEKCVKMCEKGELGSKTIDIYFSIPDHSPETANPLTAEVFIPNGIQDIGTGSKTTLTQIPNEKIVFAVKFHGVITINILRVSCI